MPATATQLQLTFDAPPPVTKVNQANITAPFAGTREGWVFGWMLTIRGRSDTPVPCLTQLTRGSGVYYEPCAFGLAPGVSVHVGERGEKYLQHAGKQLWLREAVEKGLAWRIEGKQ